MKRKVFLCGFKTIMAILLLSFSGSVLAFTLIELPPLPESAPSNAVTYSAPFNTQIDPVIGAIQTHLLNTRRNKYRKN